MNNRAIAGMLLATLMATAAAAQPAVTPVDLPPSDVRDAASVAAVAIIPPAPTSIVAPAPVPLTPPAFATPAPVPPTFVPPTFSPVVARVPATPSRYRSIFAAIRNGDWYGASALIDGTLPGPLHAVARAELYLAKGSPRVDAARLIDLIETAPDLPHAAQLASLARSRGAQVLPSLPVEQRLINLSPSPRRERLRPVAGDPVSASLHVAAEPLIKNDRPAELEALLVQRELDLSPEARTEWLQRTAWTYYVVGNYADARRLAARAGVGPGEWAVQGDWVLGLSAWRQNDCAAASDAFGRVASRAFDSEFAAAGHYWAARADLVCRRPDRVQSRMRSAARLSETFYGLLANAALGLRAPPKRPDASVGGALATRPNVIAATMLADIGEARLADTLIRHQARLSGRTDHNGLLKLAARLSLPATQYFLAHNGPSGAAVHPEDRYPAPRYNPQRGWRVDKALVFAHTLQESGFRTAVVSPAGATGLMQVRPGTAGDIARARGEYFSASQLTDPAYNIEYGQTYLESLRDRGATGGLLPKVIAAYNAGPVPVERWNASVRDGGDPLLWIESLPYWETRGYVPTILRNYWVYQRTAGEPSPSLSALSQGKWPLFPTVGRSVAERVEAGQAVLND